MERLLRAGGYAGADRQQAARELGKALADAGVQDGLRKMAVIPGGPTGDDFKKVIDADIKTYPDVVPAANLSLQ